MTNSTMTSITYDDVQEAFIDALRQIHRARITSTQKERLSAKLQRALNPLPCVEKLNRVRDVLSDLDNVKAHSKG